MFHHWIVSSFTVWFGVTLNNFHPNYFLQAVNITKSFVAFGFKTAMIDYPVNDRRHSYPFWILSHVSHQFQREVIHQDRFLVEVIAWSISSLFAAVDVSYNLCDGLHLECSKHWPNVMNKLYQILSTFTHEGCSSSKSSDKAFPVFLENLLLSRFIWKSSVFMDLTCGRSATRRQNIFFGSERNILCALLKIHILKVWEGFMVPPTGAS